MQKPTDEYFMNMCIALAEKAAQSGDLPFGAIIVNADGTIIGRGSNILQQEKVVDGHAELIAFREAQARCKSRTLIGCTLYTTVEPCPGCSFQLRELHIAQVVWGLDSPVMGGWSKFKILQDTELSKKVLDYFGPPPAITRGILRAKCVTAWQEHVPDIWKSFSECGVL